MKPVCAFGGLASLLVVNTAFAQGTVLFQNDSRTMITNAFTGLPQKSKTIKIGLYFTPDLSAVSNSAALASMTLARITTNGPFDGRFFGGTVTLPAVPIQGAVVLQTKAWPTNYLTFEDAIVNGADTSVSLPWVQTTGGSLYIPTIISQWGFRPFTFPGAGSLSLDAWRVPLTMERVGNILRVSWPIGVPPNVQVNNGSSTWTSLSSGRFVNDHWEFDLNPTNTVQLFRLGQ